MKIAVINETSAGDRSADVMAALQGRGYELINAGMKKTGAAPELTYIHTGFLAALLLNAGRADFVVGGCGTGQGFLNSVMQYPNVFCGLISAPAEAWLFSRINGGNCASIPMLFGYGWAGDINFRLIFDQLFSDEAGSGYPEHRQKSQRASRATLAQVSRDAHRGFADILTVFPETIVRPVLEFPGVKEILDPGTIADEGLRAVLEKYYRR
ncbi:MAG: ribose-5-phosphate isomerase [Spirochaetes bacterium]|nr:MAG: ribose-5-phosphate isomerase [Spirochaetota bacterium]